MASLWHTPALVLAFDSTALDLNNDTLKMMLTNSTHVPDQDDAFIDNGDGDDAESGEIAVSGYTGGFGGAGRKTIANNAVTEVAASNRAKFDADDPTTWSTLGAGDTIQWAPVIKEVGSETSNPVIVSLDINGGTGIATNGGDFTVNIHADGIGYITT